MKLRNMDGNKKTGKILFEAGILIMIVTLLSTVGIWQSISNGWKVSQGGELFFQAFIQSGGNYVITYLNQESIYISFLSVLFSFLGNKEELVSIINLILQTAGVVFFYLGAKKLYRFVFPLAITVICGILSGCFYPVTADSSMHMIWFLSGLVFWMIAKGFRDMNGLFLKHILLGILLGIFCYIDLAGFFLLVTCILFTLITKEVSLKEKGLQLLCFFLSNIIGFFCMFCLWNNFLFDSVVFNQWLNDKIKYLKPENGLNQYISLVVILVVCLIFYTIKRSGKVAVPVVETPVVETPVAEPTAAATVPIEEAVSFDEVILPEIKASQENVIEDNTAVNETPQPKITPAQVEPQPKITPVQDEPQPKITPAQVEPQPKITPAQVEPQSEIKKPIKFIENPLPLPKKHVKKEMNYAFEPSVDQMHYDLNNYRFDDDYDLKDI